MSERLRNMTSIYITREDRMLLLYRIGSRVVAPSWCGIGGHFEEAELNNPEACVLRELREELNVPETDLEQLRLRYITLRLKDGEIRQNYYYFANLRPGAVVDLDCSEGIPEWVEYGRLLEREMPYTAQYVIRHYLEIGINTSHTYVGTAAENGIPFLPLENVK